MHTQQTTELVIDGTRSPAFRFSGTNCGITFQAQSAARTATLYYKMWDSWHSTGITKTTSTTVNTRIVPDDLTAIADLTASGFEFYIGFDGSETGKKIMITSVSD